MGRFNLLKCPICLSVRSPARLRMEIVKSIGIVHSSDGHSFKKVREITDPFEMIISFQALKSKLLKVLAAWVSWGWISRDEVAEVLGLSESGVVAPLAWGRTLGFLMPGARADQKARGAKYVSHNRKFDW